MDKKVIFLRSQLPLTDSRLQRYITVVRKEGIEHTIVGWNRNNSKNTGTEKNVILYNKKAPIGGGIKNILSLMTWNLFLLKVLWKYRKHYTNIHSVDFDTAIPAYIISRLLRKRYILDIYDKYTDARSMPFFISKIIEKLEYFCCKKAEKLILPDFCRIKQLKLKKDMSPIILENVPLVADFKEEKIQQEFPPLILSYVGILERKNRGIENLLNAVAKKKNEVKLLIAGDGELREVVEKKSLEYSNIIFFGAVSQKKALEIMNSSHIIVGMYYKTIKNHFYASPNKYYEHLFLGKAMLTTEGTPPGDKVEKYNTGFAIGETEQDILDILQTYSKVDLQKKFQNSSDIWKLKYTNYQELFRNKYIKLLK